MRRLLDELMARGKRELETFKEPFPRLARFIFAWGSESYDAWCFDASAIADDGEMAVVELSDEGEGPRWPTFGDFLASRLAQLRTEIRVGKPTEST